MNVQSQQECRSAEICQRPKTCGKSVFEWNFTEIWRSCKNGSLYHGRLLKQRPSLSQEHLRPARMKKNGSKKSSRILRAIRQSHNSDYSSSVICLIRLINHLFPRKHLKQNITDDRVLEEVKRTHRYSTSTQRPLSRPLEYSSEFAGCLRPACILLPLLPWVVDGMLLCLVVSTTVTVIVDRHNCNVKLMKWNLNTIKLSNLLGTRQAATNRIEP